MRRNRLTRLTEGRLRGMVYNAVKGVLREASDSVSPQSFGIPEDDTYVPSEEDMRDGNEFDRKYRPWVDNPNCTDLRSSISWASHALSRWADDDPYIYQRFVEDMDAWYC